MGVPESGLNHSLYERILNKTTEAILIYDQDGLVSWWNEPAEELFAFPDDAIPGMPVSRLIPEKYRQTESRLRKEALRGVRLSDIPGVRLTKNGKEMEVEVTYVPLPDESAGISGVIEFILPRKPVNDQPSNFPEYLMSAPIAIYTCDASGTILQFNELAEEIWGRRPGPEDKWCGSWKLFYRNGESMEKSDCPMAVAIREKRPVYGEEIIIEQPDGKRFNVLPHPRPLFNASGEVTGGVNFVIDNTSRKLIEEKKNLLVAIVQSTDDAVISKTLDGIVTSWNPAAERIFGYKASEIIGKTIMELIPDERAEEEPLIISRLKKGERVENFDTIRKTRDGRLIDVSLTISPVRDHNGNIIGASKISRDISLKKQAENELQVKNRELERMNEELKQFAYIISHDLKSPIRAISSISHFLNQDFADALGEEGVQLLKTLDGRIKRMSGLVQGILDYSRTGSGIGRFEKIELKELVNGIWNKLSINKKNVVTVNSQPVYFDRLALTQIFHNLILNALMFNDKEFLKLDIKAEQQDSNLLFSVSDNGPGIDEKYQERIFRIFQTIHLRDQLETTGVGLTITKKIIEGYDGLIWVESTPGKGATFKFTVPGVSSSANYPS